MSLSFNDVLPVPNVIFLFPSTQTMSRAAYARLFTAGFPPVLDKNGEAPEVVDPEDKVNFVMAKEDADRLKANEIVFQFLAYSR